MSSSRCERRVMRASSGVGPTSRRTSTCPGVSVGAIAATVAWVLAAMGRLEAGAIIGWWFGWSVFEVIVRLDAKPYVKEGPWWGHLYRRATVMDMICYVSFKNLLIGAALFIGLRTLGIVQV